MPDLLDVPDKLDVLDLLDLCRKVVLVVRCWNWSQNCCCGRRDYLVGVQAA